MVGAPGETLELRHHGKQRYSWPAVNLHSSEPWQHAKGSEREDNQAKRKQPRVID